jgi:V8-like Glu-specific endopeptidase
VAPERTPARDPGELLAAAEAVDETQTEDAAEAPFQLEDFEDGGIAEAFEEEIIGTDDRTLVTDTIRVPNRWICAIDILTDNPDWGKGGPKYLSKERGTGVLIGPRYVLTARHVVSDTDKIKELYVSPARNGDNTKNPFTRIKSKAIELATTYQMTVTVGQGSNVAQRSIPQLDDYALIILEKDIDSSTHSKMKGTLRYWGFDASVAAIRALEPADIRNKEIVVVGYPGDTCGKDKWSGDKAAKQNNISNCWRRRSTEWASTQWRSTGTVTPDGSSARLFHTADTYEGQSGSPIGITIDKQLHLAGIHTAENDSQTNKGVRITTRMLTEIVGWINAEAGYTAASIAANGALVIVPPAGNATKASAKEVFEQPSEERFDPTAVPQDVAEARDRKDWPLTMKRAIDAAIRDENDLTNLIFFAKHPELPTGPLDPKHPKFKPLSDEWTRIRNADVRPAIYKASEDTSLKVSGSYVAERDPMFSGETGKKFKDLVEWAAKEVDINPGLLSAVLLAEWDRRSLYLGTGEVRSFVSGTDDFYAQRRQLAAAVPAFANVHFDESKKITNINEHGRSVTTVPFKSGKDAALATAVYLKYAEVKLRKAAEKNGGNFDSLAPETRFALVRIAMAAGHGGISPDGDFIRFKQKNGKWVEAKKGEAGATLFGVASRLERVLNGEDILVRKNEPRKDPTSSGHVTNRNATILAAQAMHLSDWISGTPLTTPAQPELEDLAMDQLDDEGLGLRPDPEAYASENENEEPEQLDPEAESADEYWFAEPTAAAQERGSL